jgi:hypothetical protein
MKLASVVAVFALLAAAPAAAADRMPSKLVGNWCAWSIPPLNMMANGPMSVPLHARMGFCIVSR